MSPKSVKLLWVLLLAVGLAACATKVERINTDEVRDLSGNWNDTDSRLVSEEMIRDVLSRPWLNRYTRSHAGEPPVVIVGEVRNLSHEHINVNTFIADMERALVNSGNVEVVASSTERGEIRGERKDQDLNATEATRKAMGQETGADFMLKGTINTIVDAEGRKEIKFYQVDITLISLADNRKVWVGQKKIKKFIDKRSVRF